MNILEEHYFIIELELFMKSGILILLDGKISTPDQVLRACICEAAVHYMRDYISDDKGKIRELHFNKVSMV